MLIDSWQRPIRYFCRQLTGYFCSICFILLNNPASFICSSVKENRRRDSMWTCKGKEREKKNAQCMSICGPSSWETKAMIIFTIYPKILEGEVWNLVKCRGLNLDALMPSTQIATNTTEVEDRGIRIICAEKVTTKSKLHYFTFM